MVHNGYLPPLRADGLVDGEVRDERALLDHPAAHVPRGGEPANKGLSPPTSRGDAAQPRLSGKAHREKRKAFEVF